MNFKRKWPPRMEGNKKGRLEGKVEGKVEGKDKWKEAGNKEKTWMT